MKRLALLGVLTGSLALVGCGSDELVPCPGTEEPDAGTAEQGLRRADAAPGDGREAVLVRFKPGRVAAFAAASQDVERTGGKVKRVFPQLRLVAARLTPAQRAALAQDPDVESIVPDRKVFALGWSAMPPTYLLKAPAPAGSVGEETPGLKMVQATEVWDANGDGVLDPGAPTGEGIKVCIVDSGIDFAHPELRIPYVGGKDFVDNDAFPWDYGTDNTPGGGHGTHVAGTIAAQLASGGTVNPKDSTLDRNGVVGVAPGASLLIARVLDIDGSGDTSDVIAAADWCVSQGAKVISLSLGADAPVDAERTTFANALDAGVLSVAATGNAGNDLEAAYPAAYDSVMGVGAVQADGGVAGFSQRFRDAASDGGEKLGSVVAPGTSVQSTMIVGRGAAYTEELSVGGQSFEGEGLEYAPVGDYSGELVDCGVGDSLAACGERASCDGFVAYVERGAGVTFADKARHALQRGAKAIIFGNNDAADDASLAFTLGDEDDKWVPTVAVTTSAAAGIKGRIGERVTLRLVGTDYAVQQGTSMATPHVSGVAALVWSARPSLTPLQVRDLLQRTAKELGPEGYDPLYGYGLVQAKDALDELLAPTVAPAP